MKDRKKEKGKPLIGIPAKSARRYKNDYWHRMEVCDELRLAVMEYGGIALMLLPSEKKMDFNESDLGDETILSDEEIADLHQEVNLCDGILLQGGDYSCRYEEEIAAYAMEKDMPVLGICAGFNNLLRALHSNVREDETKSHSRYDRDYRHDIEIVKGTLLHEITGCDSYAVNSFHTMVADRDAVEAFARINAYSGDGLVEAFDVPGKSFILAVKWHPELMMDEDVMKRLFERFVNACQKYRDRRE